MAGERVLVIDDKPESVELLAEYILRPAGYIPLVATDSEKGLQMALEERPDLLIVDQKMPKLSGLDILRALRDHQCDIPAILITAYGSEAVIVEALRLGVRDYITKPFDVDELLGAVDKTLKEFNKERARLRVIGELEERIKDLSTIYGVSQEKVLNLVVETAVHITGAEEGYLLLVDEQSNELHLRAAQNMGDQYSRDFKLRVDDTIAGRVVRTGEPVLFNWLEAEQRFKIKTGYLVKSLLNVPLKVRDRVIGVLGVDNQISDKTFTRNDLLLLTTLAGHAAIAIENAQLFAVTRETLERRMRELSAMQTIARDLNATLDADRIASLVLLQALQMTEAQTGMIGVLSEGFLTWTSRGYLTDALSDEEFAPKWDKGVLGRVTRTGQPALIADVRSDPEVQWSVPTTRSQLAVPIRREDKVIGIIDLESGEVGAFNEDDLRFLMGLADHAAVALENARLFGAVMEEQWKTKLILRSIADGVYTVDRDLRILTLNPSAEKLTGWREAEVVGRPCSEVFQEQAEDGKLLCKEQCQLRQAMLTGKPIVSASPQRILIGKDGHQIPIASSAAPLLGRDNRVIGAVAVFRDVSAERELDRMKSEFISMVSHQLRSPLASINASAELMLGSEVEPALQREMLELIRTQCISLGKFVEDILNVSRLEAGWVQAQKEPVTLLPLIKRTINLLKVKTDKHTFKVVTSGDVPFVIGDASKIEVILHNLLENAMKYSPAGGIIVVEVHEEGDQVITRVIDQGIGIPEDQQDKIFERFHRVDSGDGQAIYGYGLGLYTSKKLTELQGGKLWVQSKLGEGSCFSVSLPRWNGEE
ncbi:MAG: GAF domain-containing protein [Anaerolineae bacterium]|jgi:PAS domain S-box-containing protein|nr:GAF domain-containing protein [Anaerolineae bacterium]MDH7473317.1 GAF domain-containing protein [Anaerolineae bacterium]